MQSLSQVLKAENFVDICKYVLFGHILSLTLTINTNDYCEPRMQAKFVKGTFLLCHWIICLELSLQVFENCGLHNKF